MTALIKIISTLMTSHGEGGHSTSTGPQTPCPCLLASVNGTHLFMLRSGIFEAVPLPLHLVLLSLFSSRSSQFKLHSCRFLWLLNQWQDPLDPYYHLARSGFLHIITKSDELFLSISFFTLVLSL